MSKYKFNPESLEYEKSGASKKKKVFRFIITQITAAIFIAVLLFIAFSYVAKTPAQKNLKKEIQVMEHQYDELQKRKQQADKYLAKLKEKDRKIYRVVFETELEEDTTSVDNSYKKFENLDIVPLASENKKELEALKNSLKAQKKEYETILALLEEKKDEIKNIPAIQPIVNINLKYPVYGFGTRIDPIYKSPAFHPGIDFAATEGTPVFATADGRVKKAANERGHGKIIKIEHGNGYSTIYSHLKDMKVGKGKKVKRGDIIGTIGNTGKSFIPHLHYEVRMKNKPVNPVNYFFLDLNPEKYEKIRKATAKAGLSLD